MNQSVLNGSRRRLQRGLALFGLFLLALALGLPGNDARRPLDAHEVFVARTALEMQRLGEYVVPFFGGQIRLQKPPLNYWLAVAAERASHAGTPVQQTEFSARLPSIALGALTVVATAALGWIVFDSLLLGALGAVLFATSLGYLTWARSAQPEMSYTCACTLFVLAAAWARREALAGRGSWRAACCAGVALGLAMLAKGPLLPAFLLAGAGIALRKRAGGLGAWRTLHLGAGLGIALLCSLPYFLLVVQRAPEALEFWRSQMFDRTGGVGEAWWRPLEFYYAAQVLKLLLPWSAVWLLVPYLLVREARAAHAPAPGSEEARFSAGARFVAWCALVPCVVLSFSAGRKGYYLLPTMPLWCLLTAWASAKLFARATHSLVSARRLALGLRLQAGLLASAVALLLAAVLTGKSYVELESAELAAACTALALALLLAGLGLAHARRDPWRSALALLACAGLGVGVLAMTGLSSPRSRFSNGEFAREVARSVDPSRPLLMLHGDQQVLLFYTDQLVTDVDAQGLSLDHELERAPLPWIVDSQSHWTQTGVPGRVVVRQTRFASEDPLVLVDPSPSGEPRTESAPAPR